MSAFDEKAYKQTLKETTKSPLRESIRSVLQDLDADPTSTSYYVLDLEHIFGVPDSRSATSLKEWYPLFRATLNKNKSSGASVKSLIDKIEAQLEATKQASIKEPAFWKQATAKRSDAQREHIFSALATVKSEYPLQAATIDALTQRLESMGIPNAQPNTIRPAANKAGLTLIEPIKLPEETLPKEISTPWNAAKKFDEYRHIVDVILFHDPKRIHDVHVCSRFTVGGKPVTVSDMQNASKRFATTSDGAHIPKGRALVDVLIRKAAQPEVLRTVVLRTLLDSVKDSLNKKQPQIAVRDQLERQGINKDEATAIVFSASQMEKSNAPILVSAQIHEALNNGDLTKAKQLVERNRGTANKNDSDLHAAIERVDTLLQRRDTAEETRRKAIANKDWATAEKAIDELSSIDSSQDSEALRQQLPPARPTFVHADPSNATSVTITWSGSDSSEEKYTVIRTVGTPAVGPSSGDTIARAVCGTSISDNKVPLGTPVIYTLFAVRDNGMHSDPIATQPVVLAPAPTGISVNTTTNDATVSWNKPTQASSVTVEITGPGNFHRYVEEPQSTSTTFTGLQLGTRYSIAVSAVYIGPNGPQQSTAVPVDATPRGVAHPIMDLQVHMEESPGAPTNFEATWTEIPGFNVELWQFRHTYSSPVGQIITPQTLKQNGGRRLTPLRTSSSNGTSRNTYRCPNEMAKLVPIVLTDNGSLLGKAVLLGNVPALHDINSDMFGDELRISFQWPGANYKVRVEWKRAGIPDSKVFSSVDYRTNAGIRLRRAADISDITLTTITVIDGHKLESPPARVSYQAQAPTEELTYTLKIKKPWFGKKYTCLVSATCSRPNGTVPVHLLFKPGTIMPIDDNDGQHRDSAVLKFQNSNAQCEFDLGKADPPFWLGIVSDDKHITVIHPHSNERKVLR